MNFSERLKELRGARTLLRRPQLLGTPRTEDSYNRISEKYEQASTVGKTDYDLLLVKLRQAASLGSMSSLSLRDFRLASSCLFDGAKRLADDELFLDQFLTALLTIKSRVVIKRLIHSYCVHFDPSHPGVQRIGIFLREAIYSIPESRHWEWPTRHRQHALFDPTQAPERLARLMFGNTEPRMELEQIGLSGQLLASGLSTCIFLDVLKLVREKLSRNPELDDIKRVIAWATADDGRVYYSAHRGALANALLLPWEKHEPDQIIRQNIQDFLLEKLSDPRIDGGAWLGADEHAREVMVRWLAQATLEQFLKVVDRVAAQHQWNYRRAFWNAYIEKRVVANAWVAFGSSGAHVARKLADDTSDSLMRRFATLGGAGSDQAVLLLQIGDLVVADWSHNGRLRIWRRGNPSAPQFNLQSYIASDLRADSEFDTVHLPPDGWQAKAENFIRRHTGIRLVESDYMPRRGAR